MTVHLHTSEPASPHLHPPLPSPVATGKTGSSLIGFTSCSPVRVVPDCQSDILLPDTMAIATLFNFFFFFKILNAKKCSVSLRCLWLTLMFNSPSQDRGVLVLSSGSQTCCFLHNLSLRF